MPNSGKPCLLFSNSVVTLKARVRELHCSWKTSISAASDVVSHHSTTNQKNSILILMCKSQVALSFLNKLIHMSALHTCTFLLAIM